MADKQGFQIYNSDLDAFSLYHLVQEDSENESHAKQTGGPVLPALGHALAGALAAALAKSTVYPIETIVTRMQVQAQLKGKKETTSAASNADVEYTSLLDAARKIYKVEGGLKGFYPGVAADVSKGMLDTFLFFFAYTALRTYQAKKDNTKHLSVLKELGVGILAGCFSKAITTPIQNVVTRQQTAALISARDPTSTATPEQSDQLSFKDVALQIRAEKGIAGFWSGYSASMILTLNPSMTFAAENALRRLLPRSQRENPSVQTTFLLAAISKVIATTITYPVMLAKSRAQASRASPKTADAKAPGGAAGRPIRQNVRKTFNILAAQAALLASLRDIYRREGVVGLYAGLEGEILKGFLQHGLTMTIKESVHGSVVQTYFALLKLTKRWPENLQQAQSDVGAVVSDAGERVSNVAGTVASGVSHMGKRAVASDPSALAKDAGNRVSNVSTTVAEGAKSVSDTSLNTQAGAFARGAGERVSSISGTVAQGVTSLGSKAVDSDLGAIVKDAGDRVGNVSETVLEGVKSLGGKAVDSDAGAVAKDVGQRIGNVPTTVAEGVKSLGKQAAESVAGASANDVGQRVSNVSQTVVEGVRNVGERAINSDAGAVANDARERVDNVSGTLFEGVKSVAKKAGNVDE